MPGALIKTRATEYYGIATWSFLGLACLYLLIFRFLFAWQFPLWLDESWTAALSAAPAFNSFVHQMLLDSNAPLYYFLLWLWPFESDFGLRLPSVLFLLAAAAAAIRWGPLSYKRNLFWAALLVLWPQGISLFSDARYYALLYLLATLQTIAFERLMRDPTLKRACLWSGLSTLAILTHYYAALLALAQGLFYLWRYRRRAIASWPAALISLPAFAWLIFHWPRLTLYAEAGTSWYSTLAPLDALKLLIFPWGGWWVGVVVVGTILLFSNRRSVAPEIAAVGLTALASIAALLIAAVATPIFTPRYLLPMVPPLLFCTAAIVRFAAFLPIATLLFLPASGLVAASKLLNERANFGLERAAKFVPPDSSVTWWIDYSGSRIHDRPQMEAMLADAFARAGKPLRRARWGLDAASGDAFIVLYEDGRPRTIAAPTGWRCRELSGWGHTTAVCQDVRTSDQLPYAGTRLR